MRKKIQFIFILILMGWAAVWAQSEQPAALMVGGNFSSQVNNGQAVVFDTAARDAEIAALNQRLKEKDFNGTIQRIKELAGKNFVDKRFYLLLTIAYDGLGQDDDVVYSAGQAIAVAPQDPRGYILRAKAYLHLEDYERSRIDIEKALHLNPKSQMAQKIKAELDEKTKSKTLQTALETNRVAAPWLWICVAVVLLALVIFVYLRYEDVFRRGPKSAYSRSEADIKEQYDFLRQIGEGGMGKVYEAYDKVLKRKVAIKRVRPELVRSAYVREQFLAEARTVALLRHPYIVEIYTVIESESSLYLVFEYVDGQTLETRLDIDGRIAFSEAKKILNYPL